MIEGAAGRRPEEDNALNKMCDFYGEALVLPEAANSSTFFYPAINRFAAELSLRLRGKPGRLDTELLMRIRESLSKTNKEKADFWSVAAESELQLYLIIDQHRLADHWTTVDSAYGGLHERVPSVKYWRSVYDQCEFVLSNYARLRTTRGREKTAVDQLLRRLWAWTGEDA